MDERTARSGRPLRVSREAVSRYAALLPALSLLFTISCGAPESPDPSDLAVADLDDAALADAGLHPNDWRTHGRTYGETRHSPLDRIHDGNVDRLGLAWSFETGLDRGHEATPLVVDGTIYTTASWVGGLRPGRPHR